MIVTGYMDRVFTPISPPTGSFSGLRQEGGDLGKASMEKKRFRATWSFFFGRQNSRFESQFRTKNTIYTI